MGAFNRCMDCRFVDWDRTVAGRLHPKGGGRCVWTKAVALPASMATHDRERLLRELNRVRWINRDRPVATCDTFVRAEPKDPDQ